MRYEEAIAYIHSVNWLGSRPGLERITVLCEKLGHPQKNMRFIHVAGTNGKGSFCCMLSAILTAAGYKTGLFTSPYIERFNERMQIDGADISCEELAALTEEVKACADTMEDTPTEFELITAIAFLYYRNHGCDYVVLETGLGGRLDSTNCISAPVLAVITGIDLDHTAVLGETTAAIAGEKAGIIKAGCSVLYGETDAAAETVIRDTCSRCGCMCRHTAYEKIESVTLSADKTVFSFGSFRNVSLGLRGRYQLRNGANVLTAVEMLRERGVHIPDTAVYAGMENARWPARFERLMEVPPVYYDGAHNPQGVAAACENIQTYLTSFHPDGKIALCMGVLRDKNYEEMIEQLAPYAAKAFTITPDNPRALTAGETAAIFVECGVDAEPFSVLASGVKEALRFAANEKRPLVILGSLYMYGDVKKALLAK